MPLIPFAEWRPDMPALSQWAREATNVVSAEESYVPLNALAGVSSALGARAQGAAWFRGTAGNVKMFAGDATKLYLLSGTTWNDASRTSGGAYTLGGDGAWRFTQFGTLAIAVNGIDAPQKFDLSVGTNWLALGGSPPIGTFVTTVRDFVLMGKFGSDFSACSGAPSTMPNPGRHRSPPRPTSRICPTAATSRAWSAARSA